MQLRRNSPQAGLTAIELLIIVGIILVVCAIAIPGLLSSKRASNERHASTALKTLSSAEADFRANDRDWNHVTDFWTADVKGLYTMTSAAVRGVGTPKDPPIRLIELDIAAADGDELNQFAAGENLALSHFAQPAAKTGYWYMAMIKDATLEGTAEESYKQDTLGDPRMGLVHNTSKFGFTAFPESNETGKFAFLVNENNTIFRQATNEKGPQGPPQTPGVKGLQPRFLSWPDDSAQKSFWYGGD